MGESAAGLLRGHIWICARLQEAPSTENKGTWVYQANHVDVLVQIRTRVHGVPEPGLQNSSLLDQEGPRPLLDDGHRVTSSNIT